MLCYSMPPCHMFHLLVSTSSQLACWKARACCCWSPPHLPPSRHDSLTPPQGSNSSHLSARLQEAVPSKYALATSESKTLLPTRHSSTC